MHGLIGKGASHAPRAQFVRLEIYSIQGVAPKTKGGVARKGKASIVQIINEATRATPEGYQHLTQQGLAPKPPVCLHGLPMGDLFDWYAAHKKRAAQNRFPYRAASRRQNITWPTLLSEVMSYPGPPDQKNANYTQWKRLCVERLQSVYGSKLVSVLEHTDEGHGHLHALAANPDATPIRPLHPGHRASDACLSHGGTHKEAQAAYVSGLADFQEQFHETVGRPAQLARMVLHPKARHSYTEARIRQQAETELADQVAKVNSKVEAFERQKDEYENALLRRISEVEADAGTAMQRAFRRASELAEAKYAKEAARNAEDRAQLDWEITKLDRLTAHVREMKSRADASVEAANANLAKLVEAIGAEVDSEMFARIMHAMESASVRNPGAAVR